MEVDVIIPYWGDFDEKMLNEARMSVQNQIVSNVKVNIIEPPSTKEVQEVEGISSQLGRCRNLMIKKSSAPLILPLDADDKIHPYYLARTMAHMEEHNADIVYTFLKWFGDMDHEWPMAEFQTETLLQGNYITCCSLYKREMWEKYHYPEDMVYGYEDWDFWVGGVKNGYVPKLLPEYLFFYRRREGQMINTSDIHRPELIAKIREHHKDFYEEIGV